MIVLLIHLGQVHTNVELQRVLVTQQNLAQEVQPIVLLMRRNLTLLYAEQV
jgi:hypothetical protein